MPNNIVLINHKYEVLIQRNTSKIFNKYMTYCYVNETHSIPEVKKKVTYMYFLPGLKQAFEIAQHNDMET